MVTFRGTGVCRTPRKSSRVNPTADFFADRAAISGLAPQAARLRPLRDCAKERLETVSDHSLDRVLRVPASPGGRLR